MSNYMFLHIFIHILMVITSEIKHVVHRKLPNPILSIILRPYTIYNPASLFYSRKITWFT